MKTTTACTNADHDANVLSNYLNDAAEYEEAIADVASLFTAVAALKAILAASTFVQREDCPIRACLAESETDLLDAVDRLVSARSFLAPLFPMDLGLAKEEPVPTIIAAKQKTKKKQATKH